MFNLAKSKLLQALKNPEGKTDFHHWWACHGHQTHHWSPSKKHWVLWVLAGAGQHRLLEKRGSFGLGWHSTWSGSSLMHAAAQGLQPDTLVWLLARGADANARDAQGKTPLMEAMIGYGENRDGLEWGRWTNGDWEQVLTLLLEAGAQVDAVDHQGRTALHWAAHTAMPHRTGPWLAQHGSDWFAPDQQGKTPWALLKGRLGGPEEPRYTGVAQSVREMLSGLQADRLKREWDTTKPARRATNRL